jgi:hypothetical protein
MAVVVAIIAILAAITVDSMRRSKPRATLSNVSAELQSLVHGARLQAMASGSNVAVMVFPDYQSTSGLGRIVVYQESTKASDSLFTVGAPLLFDDYDPKSPAATPPGQVITTYDLPAGIYFGPDVGLGVDSPPFPYKGITTNVRCSFCADSAVGLHGAIVFASNGQARFYSATGPAAVTTGGSFSICASDLLTIGTSKMVCGPETATGVFSTSTLVITTASGTGRTFKNG